MITKYDSFITYSILKKSEKQQVLRIEKIYPLKNGNLLVGTLTRGVKLFDVNAKTFPGYRQPESG